MIDEKLHSKTIDKLITVEDKLSEIKSIINVLNIWVKENSYELIPIIKLLNSKMEEVTKIFRK